VRVGVGARKSGDPFTVLIAAASKPRLMAAINETHTKSPTSRAPQRAAKEIA
jgi:hypothetical protein